MSNQLNLDCKINGKISGYTIFTEHLRLAYSGKKATIVVFWFEIYLLIKGQRFSFYVALVLCILDL
ncbi:hypothetical protein DERF_012187 [Dermatophagoides farinae]|uniref:Uncharacterized protein n=1 Tax=Dermatophagoides farinae TaxID=6954 RepID=A0A922KWX8_DERFA|nr:hypothetical protein DERF_012187 [Dermatophagoides farinae]